MYITRNTGLEEAQAGIKIAGRNINKLRYADDTTVMAESEEELKSLLMKIVFALKKLSGNQVIDYLWCDKCYDPHSQRLWHSQ